MNKTDQAFPPCGPCLICGGPDKRHRLWDAIRERYDSGETTREIAGDYELPVQHVRLAIRASRRAGK